MPLTVRNLNEDLGDVGSDLEGAPDIEFRLATRALEQVALTDRAITDRDRLRQEIERVREPAAVIEVDLASNSPRTRAR